MRITTWNVNGLRAALRKGFERYLLEISPDVLLLQEVRSLPEQLPVAWREPAGWHVYWHPAHKKGYAGTAIWSRTPLMDVEVGLGDEDDVEGRVVSATVRGVRVSSVYLPSGSSREERQREKERWMARFRPWCDNLYDCGMPVVIGGDLNIARSHRDLFYAQANQETSGFLPHERWWMDDLVTSGWLDVVREDYDKALADNDLSTIVGRYGVEGEGIDPAQHGPYSWWSNRGQARAKNRGWRIDYLLANPLAQKVDRARIGRQAGIEVSDHAPVTVDLDL